MLTSVGGTRVPVGKTVASLAEVAEGTGVAVPSGGSGFGSPAVAVAVSPLRAVAVGGILVGALVGAGDAVAVGCGVTVGSGPGRQPDSNTSIGSNNTSMAARGWIKDRLLRDEISFADMP
jgi:hypothetical protein